MRAVTTGVMGPARMRWAAVSVVAVLLLSGCPGGGDDSQDPTASNAPYGSSSGEPSQESASADVSPEGPSVEPGELPQADAALESVNPASWKPIASGEVNTERGLKLDVEVLEVIRNKDTLTLTAALTAGDELNRRDVSELSEDWFAQHLSISAVRLVHGGTYVVPLVGRGQQNDDGHTPSACVCSSVPLAMEKGNAVVVTAVFADFKGKASDTVDVQFPGSEPIKDVKITDR